MAGNKKSKKSIEKHISKAMGKNKKNRPSSAKTALSGHRKSTHSNSHSNHSPRNTSVNNIFGTIKSVEGVFSYSGRGFGFVIPDSESVGADSGTSLPDIFIPPRETKGAMTGDRVKVTITKSEEHRGDRQLSVEGEVQSVEYLLDSVIGTLHVIPEWRGIPGYSYVTPDRKNLGIIIYVPEKDVSLLGAKDLDKVEVVPSGEEHFTRTKSITVRGPADMPYFDTTGRITKVFGSSLTRDANYSAVLYSSGIRTVFPDSVLECAKNAASEDLLPDGKIPSGRIDLRGKTIFTIDGAGAKDLDDAVSLEKTESGYILGVHIADVSHYVRQNSPVELEARERGTSVYFTDKVVPMLPETLSNGACSLNAGEDKFALSAIITLDNDGTRLNTVIHKSIIRSSVRGVYDEVNAIFRCEDYSSSAGVSNECGVTESDRTKLYEKYAPVIDMLRDMRELYAKLKAKQDARGVMELEDDEAIILVDADSNPVEIIRRERGDGEKLIEQFMLQANMGVAEVLTSLALPCLYRVHEQPSEEKLKNFATFVHNLGLDTRGIMTETNPSQLNMKLMAILNDARERNIADVVSELMLRSMMKARYEAVCSMHFGLGAETYCHFTSPIRRYPDLFVHTVITSVLEGLGLDRLTFGMDEDVAYDKLPSLTKILTEEAESRGKTSTECEITAQNAERDIEDLYMALYMQPKVGEVFDVSVVSVIRSGMFVRCDNLVEGFIPAAFMPASKINDEQMTLYWDGKVYTIGTKLQVRLSDVDVPTRKITFEPYTETRLAVQDVE